MVYLAMPIEVVDTVLEEDSANKQKVWLDMRVAEGKKSIAVLLKQAWTLTLLLKHPRAPWTSRVVAGCTVSHLLSPIQVIPTFIPVIGQLDDLFVLFIGMKLIRRLTPSAILAECEQRAESSTFHRRVGGEPGLPATEPGSVPAV
jgi:uncharacterized membrane protein YkvA (DUF1232 family)